MSTRHSDPGVLLRHRHVHLFVARRWIPLLPLLWSRPPINDQANMLDMLCKTDQPLHGNGHYGEIVCERYAAGFDKRDGDHQGGLWIDVCRAVGNDAGARYKWCLTSYGIVAWLDSIAFGGGDAGGCIQLSGDLGVGRQVKVI